MCWLNFLDLATKSLYGMRRRLYKKKLDEKK
jgi:hypothetical protein